MFYNENMDNKELEKITKSIETTVGSDLSGAIAADIGKIMTGFEMANQTIADRESQIAELRELNQKLVASNGDLLRQVTQNGSNDVDDFGKAHAEPEKPPISLNDAFGKNGTFKH